MYFKALAYFLESAPKSFGSWIGRLFTCEKTDCPSGIFPLTHLPCGVCVVVRALNLPCDKAEALRRMGIREGSKIHLINKSGPLVIALANSRIALSTDFSPQVQVERGL